MTDSSVKGWSIWKSISCSFCIVILYVGTSIYLNSYSYSLYFAKWTWRAHRHSPPFDRWIRHATMIQTCQPSISWSPLPAEIFNSAISAGMYHGQRVSTSVLWQSKRSQALFSTMHIAYSTSCLFSKQRSWLLKMVLVSNSKSSGLQSLDAILPISPFVPASWETGEHAPRNRRSEAKDIKFQNLPPTVV